MISETNETMGYRHCLREPIPEIWHAAYYLDEAVTAHLNGKQNIAEELIRKADIQQIREWTDSIWGQKSIYVQYRNVDNPLPFLPKEQRITRMPTTKEQYQLHERDGYNCRFCGIPVIRKTIRDKIRKIYPLAIPWGNTTKTQHAAFQAMNAQYDHIIPHSRGGNNDLENLVITCAPCNFGRMSYTLDEVGLVDPRERAPLRTGWDGLERFRE